MTDEQLIDIAIEISKKAKLFSSIEIIRHLKDNMNVKIDCDSNHIILNIENK